MPDPQHFQISPNQYLRALSEESYHNDVTKPEAKRRVLDSCIFGVDINRRAVRLAKMALWLETAHQGKKLERLDDQLYVGDSLIDALSDYEFNFSWKKEIFEKRSFVGFDALVGNPPWDKLKPSDLDFFQTHFPDYSMVTEINKAETRKKLLADAKISKLYEAYVAKQERVMTYLKEHEDYKHQIAVIDGSKSASDTNLYKYFLERFVSLACESGKIGIVLPAGINSDRGTVGLRKMCFETCKVDRIISFKNKCRDRIVFEDVEPNALITVLMLTKGGRTSAYESKFIEWISELKNLETVQIDRKLFQPIFLDYQNFVVLHSSKHLTLQKKLNKFGRADSVLKMQVSDGEAHMTSCKKYFLAKPGKYSLVTGKDFRAMQTVSKTSVGVDQAFAGKVEASKAPRLILKAILPNSKKKIQAGVAAEGCILSNNLFAVKIEDTSYVEALMALLNSNLMEFRIRSFMANFRLSHRTLKEIPVDKSILETMQSKAFQTAVRDVVRNPSEAALRKFNLAVYGMYDMTAADIELIENYIYGGDETEEDIEEAS